MKSVFIVCVTLSLTPLENLFVKNFHGAINYIVVSVPRNVVKVLIAIAESINTNLTDKS